LVNRVWIYGIIGKFLTDPPKDDVSSTKMPKVRLLRYLARGCRAAGRSISLSNGQRHAFAIGCIRSMFALADVFGGPWPADAYLAVARTGGNICTHNATCIDSANAHGLCTMPLSAGNCNDRVSAHRRVVAAGERSGCRDNTKKAPPRPHGAETTVIVSSDFAPHRRNQRANLASLYARTPEATT
jgi:hypothetical protein